MHVEGWGLANLFYSIQRDGERERGQVREYINGVSNDHNVAPLILKSMSSLSLRHP